MVKICLVAAVSNSGAIGAAGDLLWHYKDLPTDMDHFRRVTRGSVVLMGRKTWDSLSIQPLPGRKNVVVSKDPSTLQLIMDNLYVSQDMDGALYKASEYASQTNSNTIFCIGGGKIYRALIPSAHEMWITHVDVDLEGDTYFPTINEEDWIVDEQLTVETDKYPLTFKHYVRTGTDATN